MFILLTSNVDILETDNTEYDCETRKRYNYITVKQDYRELLIRNNFDPLILPMIAPPKEWVLNLKEAVGGGFYTKAMNKIVYDRIGFVKQGNNILMNSEINPIQIKTINYLNKQKYKIINILNNYRSTLKKVLRGDLSRPTGIKFSFLILSLSE